MSTRIDSHIHLFRNGYHRDLPEGEDQRHYDRLRRDAGIDAALVVGYEGDGFAGNNDDILDLAREHPWIVPFPYLDPAGEVAPDDVARWGERGARGVALYIGDAAQIELIPQETWRAVREHTPILSVNAPAVVWRDGLAQWAERLETPILVSHLGLPGRRAADPSAVPELMAPLLRLARSAAHVSVKISGAYAIDPTAPHHAAAHIVESIVEGFGAARACWGSDFSPALGSVDEADLFDLPAGVPALTEAERSDLLGGTVARLLRTAHEADPTTDRSRTPR